MNPAALAPGLELAFINANGMSVCEVLAHVRWMIESIEVSE